MKLDNLIRDTKREKTPEPDWKSIDEKLFARIEQEPRPVAEERTEHERGGRVVWIGAALSLAAAAAALVFVHPTHDGTTSEQATAVANAHEGRIEVVDHVAYYESKNAAGETAVRWSSQPGSVLQVEHARSPLVLSLEKGVAEAQVTPVPSGEAFAIDVTSSSGDVVRVAVHGTHLRVARDGDKVIVDLTEGVVSIGAPPRRGSTIGTLVTAPAHVELDARDLASLRVDHEASAVRIAENVTPQTAETDPRNASREVLGALAPPAVTVIDSPRDVHPQAQQVVKPTTPTTTVVTPAPTPFSTPDELASAIAACGKDAVAPHTTFATTLTLQVGDDGSVQNARFSPPLVPEARDCAAIVIYKRTKLTSSTGNVDVPVTITR